MQSIVPIVLVLALGQSGLARAAYLPCAVTSPAATAALVELYTSEGCSSCPPADRALSQLRQEVGPQAVLVPLALHVSYWDQIGWKDGFAQKIFDARQSRLLAGQQNHVAQHFVYTPQFFVNGAELRSWQRDLPSTIRRINTKPAPLTITLKSTPLTGTALLLEAQVRAIAAPIDGVLYLAVTESGLLSAVRAGENKGVTLHHDDAVRIWLGPLPLTADGTRVRQEIQLESGWDRTHLQAVAFVQQAGDGAVLQAVSTAQCEPVRGL